VTRAKESKCRDDQRFDARTQEEEEEEEEEESADHDRNLRS